MMTEKTRNNFQMGNFLKIPFNASKSQNYNSQLVSLILKISFDYKKFIILILFKFLSSFSWVKMKQKQRYDFMSKLIVIGDSGVGKTNIIIKFTEEYFKDNYVATIGVDFKVKTIQVDDKKIRLQIWDTAGQQRYRNITETYYKGAAGIVLVYAVNDRNTFLNLERWIIQMQDKTDKNINKIIVCNKCDTDQGQRQVSYQQGKQLAKKYSTQTSVIDFLQVSAKTGQGIEDVFYNLAKKIKDQLEIEFKENNPTLKITKTTQQKTNSAKNCKC